MPLNSKKGAASYGVGGTRVPTAPLVSCLTCPLCTSLFRDATTISECLHTFCRDCIYNRLNDGETNTCPVCNVSLGTVPLEKLRADHQLNDVKLKLFPETVRKRKNGPGSSPAVSGAPMRRKERSLYSLGIGAQPSLANPGYATRTTRRSSGKSVAGRESSSSDDEHEEADDMDDEEEEDMQTEDDESHESQGVLPDPASPIAASNSKGYHVELSSDEEEIFPHRPSRAKEEPRRAPARELPRVTSTYVGMYHAHRSKITANGFSRTRSENYSDAVASAEGPLTAGAATQDERNSSADSLLATLAEVAGADSSGASRARKSSQAEPQRARSYGLPAASPDLLKVRDANNDAKSTDVRHSGAGARDSEGRTLRASPPRARRSSPHLQKNHHSLKSFANGGVERPAILKHPTAQQPAVNGSYLGSTSFQSGQCGIWFALQAARNQSESPLPQLSSPYLRIKDGKLPVSHVKKYLVKKLGLNNETEVEITCRGQPVVSSLPLESVRNIWFATAVPTSKDQDDQSQTSSENGPTGLMHLDNSSAKELIMVLTYQRHRRNRLC